MLIHHLGFAKAVHSRGATIKDMAMEPIVCRFHDERGGEILGITIRFRVEGDRMSLLIGQSSNNRIVLGALGFQRREIPVFSKLA